MDIENIINPKSLERQIKIIEQRLTELQRETSALEERRTACFILLGQPVVPMGSQNEEAPVAPPKKSARPKKKVVVETAFEPENEDSQTEDLDHEDEVSVIRASELHSQSV